ncbi:MAG: histidine kinase [Lachnospiraceae bacterium]|nr:histidine kinase [Lachnospiraceae bacterium]
MLKKIKKMPARKMLLMISMLFLVPFFLFLVGFTFYSNYIHEKQLAQNNLSKIELYQSFLEEDLQCAEFYLADMVANDYSYVGLCYPSNDLDAWLNMYNLKEKMNTVIKTVNSVDALYIFSMKNDTYRASYSEDVTYEEQENMKGYLRTLLQRDGDSVARGWRTGNIQGRSYFMKILGNNQVYCVCMVDANYVSRAEKFAAGSAYLDFAAQDEFLSYEKELKKLGVKLRTDKSSYISGKSHNQLVVRKYSKYLDCDIFYVEPYLGIWETEATPFILLIATLIFSVLMVSCYHLLKKEFLNPLKNMVGTMDEIVKSGSEDISMAVDSPVQEYDKVEETFNDMMQHIRQLKILAYDRMIQVQETQLQYYQIQIRPHFFLNCMKNLYAMTAARKYAQMQEMILTMSNYLRSVFQDHAQTVLLSEEMASVSSYVKLQQMSSALPPVFTQDIQEGLENFEIPPMSILTFVENSCRYQKGAEQALFLHVKAKRFYNGEEQFINITIMDNGCGFSDEVMEILNDPSRRLHKEHIGIYNVQQRFELIYGKTCSFVFQNMNGACVDIFIPQSEGNSIEEEGVEEEDEW